MSPVEHNAWAQMKAREREQRLSDSDRGKYSLLHKTKVNSGQVPTRKPSTITKPSGLDNNAELALLKPEPHPASPKEMPTADKPGVTSKPNVTKKRSTTEPSMPSDRSSGSTDKKKKSKVATLRSKFSLKDLAKEYRKDIPPMSSMPKLGGSSGSGTQHTSSDSEEQSKFTHTFSEAKLYVPKTRTGDMVPNSAPPHTSEFRDSASTDKQSILSCRSVQIPPTKGNDDGKTEAKFKHSLVHNTGVGQGTPNARLETMLLDGSSPPARTGEYKNTGQPELIRVHDRVMSLKAGKNETVMPSSPRTPPPISVRSDAAAYSPSVYDTAKEVGWKAAKSSLPEVKDIKPKHPFIVSSSDFKEKAREEQDEDHMFLDPREPPLPPLPLKSRDRAVRSNPVDSNAINEAQYLTGVTSHGGYAPPPPHPGYQNTVTLDQQLASHVDSLHYHLDTTVNRLARTFENGNNWSADQILKQVDSVFDLARMINTRSATQADIMKNLSQISMEARNQAYLARQETSLVEERMKSFVQQEVAKLKNELSDLILSSHDNPKAQVQGQDSRADTSHTGDQEGPKLTIGKRNQHQNKNKSRLVTAKRDALTKPTDNRNGIAESQEGKLDSVRQAEPRTDKEPTPQNNQNISDDVPTPTAAYRTPKPRIDDVASPVPVKREVRENPGEESSGSPKGKAGKLRISGPMPISESPSASGDGQRENSDTNRPSSPQRESESKPRRVSSSDNLKTPKKKGSVFSFRRKCDGDNQSGSRFLRTPRRTKETKSVSSQESQSPRFAISTPTKTRAAPAPLDSITSTTSSNATANALEGGQIQRQESPSMIHPALRNSQQRQVMAERERLAQLNRHPRESTQIQAQGQSNPHNTSHPLQNLGNRDSPSTSTSPPPSFVSFDGPNPYASAVSVATSSSASFHDVRQYQSSMHYPQLPSSLSLPSQGHGLGVGQPQFFAPPPGFSPTLSGENNGISHGHGHSNVSDQLDGVSIDWFRNMNMPMATNYPDSDFF
ncbi:hypothetical protein AN7261.2 [Aspergillus nidulans FGSC A4]|uniref:Uncharacterized protein n=1 Tax=Emericella nidulans (strain FGSC A4 / ATCC 38163 / CBS 112.46 / NRRL 194 / M139) TaxID=227321 RepID=Q5AWR9_EMENI|nr:hypothetical protein [Aspergillus nidulans FGSC A4]EAA61167.1 hypothetical protein AN7261.2 [Aspergillus nidulans FGSC A4]CBF78747.1 TPA: conserved hypothetical protein [Aspergillus nidulans FGSC A4]|eukprot:XP_680530.1 hypothetical protein AN7261.2 [Aspergillus nidulans FGSC A4]